MEYVGCNLCEQDETRPWGFKDGLNIVACKKCGLVYTNPRLDQQELEAYYNPSYFDDRTQDADPQRYRMYQLEVEDMSRTIKMKGRFLDVGCANGIFLTVLPNTFEKYGIEFSEEAVEMGRQKFGLNIQIGKLSEVSYQDRYFDTIHMRAVIEHMESPRKQLEAANRLLKPDGWLIVSTTPNIGGPIGSLYRERARLVYPKEHIYYFTRGTLSQMLKKTGFTPIRWVYPYWRTPYARVAKDLADFVLNYLTGRDSPPFWHSVMTVYAKKERVPSDGGEKVTVQPRHPERSSTQSKLREGSRFSRFFGRSLP